MDTQIRLALSERTFRSVFGLSCFFKLVKNELFSYCLYRVQATDPVEFLQGREAVSMQLFTVENLKSRKEKEESRPRNYTSPETVSTNAMANLHL